MREGICNDVEVEACMREGPFCPLCDSPELICPRLRGSTGSANK